MARNLERELEREIGEANRRKEIESGPVPWSVVSNKVIDVLNKATGRQFDPEGTNTRYLIGTLVENGYDVNDLILVVKVMSRKWLPDKKMAFYLRPETLFSPEHFESYLQFARSEERRATIEDELASIEDMARRSVWKSEE